MKSIANSGKYQITDNSISLDEYGRLLIRNVQFEDRGTYLCHARNRLGPVIASATLSVQGECSYCCNMVILQVGISMDSGCASVTVSIPQIKIKESVLTHH